MGKSAHRPLLLMVVACGISAGCGRNPTPQGAAKDGVAPVVSPQLKHPGCNLVFVSFDALQAAHVGALGNPRKVTPTIDAVARQGYCFTRAYSVASWTVPASMTWFTGVYPSEHGMVNKFAVYRPPVQKLAKLDEVAPRLLTLAEVLKQHGYRTGGFTGNAGVSGGSGYEKGFDVYFHEPNTFGGFDRSIPEALAWLRQKPGEKFFLFLHGYDCHGQYAPAGGFDYRFVDKSYDRRYAGDPREQETLRELGLDRGQVTLRDADVAFWRAVYDEKIQRADDRFRRFLNEFQQLGLADSTLLVLTSDHGTEFHEHRRFDHGFTLYTEQTHVPLIFKLPRQTRGMRVAERVGSIDVLPTILDVMDIDAPVLAKQLRGVSLAAAFRGEPVGRDVFSETDYRQYTYKRSIIAPDGWKLIHTLESKTRELYDLDNDPGETADLAETQPRRADALEQRLFAHFKAIGHDLTVKRWERGHNPVYTFPTKKP